MADWDADSAQLEQNLLIALETIRDNARRRTALSLETARQWHAESLRDLAVPDARYVGGFRGEPGLEKVQVHVGGRFGVAARDVASALAAFERTVQPVITRLDALILADTDPNADQLAAILEVCAWVHAEWIRIHPFANGNGRTARLWVNSIAMRYNLPPFLRLRPRPDADYCNAGAEAMSGNWQPTIAVFRQLLADFLRSPAPE
jgi:fido (protein-threonine AMPylation protein)